MGDHDHQLGVEVNREHVESIKENYKMGTISEEVRKTIEALANGGDYTPEQTVEKTAEEIYQERLESGGYPEDWGERRKEVFLRDDYTCVNCGDKGGSDGPNDLVAHHIVPDNYGGTHYVSNLATLCESCHDKAHSNIVQ